MKKHEEGYALVLVLVVITVLALVAAALMGYSLRNLQSQTASIDRMVAKYEAAGEIEKVVAKLDDLIATPKTVTFEELFGTGYTPLEATETTLKVNFTASNKNAETKIKAEINCTLLLTAEKVELSGSEYKITKLKTVEYSAYDISYEKVPEGGGA